MASALASVAQPAIKVQAPNLVSADEQFNVSFVISGENAPSAFEWTCSDDFQLVWGPQKGSSTSVSIVNGQHTRTSQTSYTYILMPKKSGKFSLPPATATVKGEKLVSSSPTIEVVSGGTSSSSSSSQGGNAEEQAQGSRQTGTVSSEDIFMKLVVSKGRAVVGETLTATLKLYQRVNISGFDDVKFPTFSGFWSQEDFTPNNIEFKRENIGDVIYNAAVLRSWTLIPQQAGDLKIDPSELVCLVNIRSPKASTGSIFDSFFQDEYQTVRKRVVAPAVTVHVSKLPAGAPESFTGGVGTFKMNAELTRDNLTAHEAASLKVTVSGKGNLNLLEAPKISFPSDFEVYDTKTTDVGGTRTFEYPFIPRSHGDFVLGPVEFTYYDVVSGKYVTLKSAEMPVTVAKGEGSHTQSDNSGQLVAAPSNRKDVRNLGSDIRYIVTSSPSLAPMGYFFAGSWLFWALAALLFISAFAAYLMMRGMAARRADVAGSKRRGATKMARRRLSLAGEYLEKDLYTAFYEELHKALLGFVSDKLSMDAFEMSKDNICERLSSRGVDSSLASEFIELLDACEFARYSPSSGHEAMNAHYDKAVNAISAIDECMGRKHKTSSAVLSAILLVLLPLQSLASEPADSLWNAGVTAYSEGRWGDASVAWDSILSQGQESAELYFNLGNALFKQNDLAGAILAYERAIKLDPSNSSVRYNLDFANSMIQDKIEVVPEFFVEEWGRKACWLLPSGTWAVLCLVFFALTLVCALLFLLSSRNSMKKLGFFAGLALVFFTFLCGDFAFWQKSDYASADSAIVTKAVSSAKSSPGSTSSVDLFVLHEGTKVQILDRVGEWIDIELSDGRQGWIQAGDITVI